MGRLVFITGGCRSGKSTFAVELAKKRRGSVAFIATAVGCDAEMRRRIREHKAARPAGWRSFEEPYRLPGRIAAVSASNRTVIIDCLTVYLSNLLFKKATAAAVEGEISRIIAAIKASPAHVIVVSNEVGYGIVPATALGRKFRDIAGQANKSFAAAAGRVYLTVAGIPVKIK